MAWLISALGAILAVAGAISLGNGISYIRLDWGQTETVAGTVALSAGVVTLATGAVLFALRDLTRRIVARPTGVGLEALSWGEDDAPVRPVLTRVRSRLATMGMPKGDRSGAARIEPVRAAPMPVSPPRDFDEPLPDRPPLAEAPPPSPVPVPVPPPREPEVQAMVEAPTVVGRYEANGASYVLFSDGTIEVETENGTHRFASMTELKDHIERQQTA